MARSFDPCKEDVYSRTFYSARFVRERTVYDWVLFLLVNGARF